MVPPISRFPRRFCCQGNQDAEMLFFDFDNSAFLSMAVMYTQKANQHHPPDGSQIYHFSMAVVAAKVGMLFPEVRARAERCLAVCVLCHRFNKDRRQYRYLLYKNFGPTGESGQNGSDHHQFPGNSGIFPWGKKTHPRLELRYYWEMDGIGSPC